VFYHTYSTYIQASNQAIRNQKPSQKGTNIPKAKKNLYEINELHKNRKNTKICAKGYMTSTPTSKSHNVLIRSQAATTNNRNPQNTKKTYKHKHIHKLKTEPHPTDNNMTHKYTTNTTINQRYTKPKTTPRTKHNYAQRHTKVIVMINWLPNFPHFSSNLITNKITILNIHNYVPKKSEKIKKEKRADLIRSEHVR